MRQSAELAPDIVTSNTGLKAFTFIASPPCKPWQQALLLLRDMQKQGLEPETHGVDWLKPFSPALLQGPE